MARGATAKSNVAKKLAEAFGKDYVGEFDKKHYVWANDGGERVQIAISMTCPKVFVGTDENSVEEQGDYDWSDTAVTKEEPVKKAEITPEEENKIIDLMARLGL